MPPTRKASGQESFTTIPRSRFWNTGETGQRSAPGADLLPQNTFLLQSTLKVRRQGGLAATRAHRRQASIGNHHSNEAARTPPASPGGCSMEHPYKLHYQSTKQHLHPPPPRRATAPEQPPRVAGRMLHGASPQVPGYQSAQKKLPGQGCAMRGPAPGWVWRKYDCLT